MITLYHYFGIVGLASIIAWVAAACLLLIYCRNARRHVHYLRALAIAAVAYGLAQINSDRVSAIETDRTEQLEWARVQQQRARDESDGPGKVRVRFAEDSNNDRLDIAGITRDEIKTLTGGSGVLGDAEPGYRKEGKQTREAGKKADTKTDEVAEAASGEKKPPRIMKEADVLRANRFDRYNLLMVNLLLWAAALAFVGDYLWRFNRAFDWYYPFPISGSWLDHLFHKSHSILVLNQRTDLWKDYLEGVVRKGETFIYFGQHALGPSSLLPRIVLGRMGVLPLRRIVYGSEGVPLDVEFFLDAVWFQEYCVVVDNPDAALKLVDPLIAYLDKRHVTRAAAPHTVNLVWTFDVLPDERLIGKLASLAAETNLRFVLASPGQVSESIVRQFSEVHPDGVARLLQVSRHRGDLEQEREARRQAKAARQAERQKASEAKRNQKEEALAAKQAEAKAVQEQAEKARVEAEAAAEEERKRAVEAKSRKPAGPVGMKRPGTGLKPRPEARKKVEAVGTVTPKAPAPEASPQKSEPAVQEATGSAVNEQDDRQAKARAEEERCLAEAARASEELHRKETEARAARERDEKEAKHQAELARLEAERDAAAADGSPRPEGFTFVCPKCGQVLSAEWGWIGMQVACPLCATPLVVPQPGTAAPELAPPPASSGSAAATFTFTCPHCQQSLTAQRDWCGMEVKCPLCGRAMAVPAIPPGT